MSSKPWYAWFPADYRAKTAHLDFLQDSAYRRLLDAYYEHHGPLPANEQALCRITGAQTEQERAAVISVASEFFTNGDGLLRHSRCDEQLAKEDELRQAWSEAGRKGGLNSAKGRTKPGFKGGSTIPHSHLHPNLNLPPDLNLNPPLPPPDGGVVVDKSSKTRGQWWLTEADTNRVAAELGMQARGGESWPDFRGRIRARINQDDTTSEAG